MEFSVDYPPEILWLGDMECAAGHDREHTDRDLDGVGSPAERVLAASGAHKGHDLLESAIRALGQRPGVREGDIPYSGYLRATRHPRLRRSCTRGSRPQCLCSGCAGSDVRGNRGRFVPTLPNRPCRSKTCRGERSKSCTDSDRNKRHRRRPSRYSSGNEKCIWTMTHFPSRFSRTPVQRALIHEDGFPFHSPWSSR